MFNVSGCWTQTDCHASVRLPSGSCGYTWSSTTTNINVAWMNNGFCEKWNNSHLLSLLLLINTAARVFLCITISTVELCSPFLLLLCGLHVRRYNHACRQCHLSQQVSLCVKTEGWEQQGDTGLLLLLLGEANTTNAHTDPKTSRIRNYNMIHWDQNNVDWCCVLTQDLSALLPLAHLIAVPSGRPPPCYTVISASATVTKQSPTSASPSHFSAQTHAHTPTTTMTTATDGYK